MTELIPVFKKRQDGKYIEIGKAELVDNEYSITLDIPKNKLLINDCSILRLGINFYDPYYYTQNNYETHKNMNYVKLENVSTDMFTFQHYINDNLKSIDDLPLAYGFEDIYWDTFDTKINDSYKKIDDNHFTLLNKHQAFLYKYRIHDERMVPVGVVTMERTNEELKTVGYLFFAEPHKRFKDNMSVSLYTRNFYVQDTDSPRTTINIAEFYPYLPEAPNTKPLYKRVPLDEIWLSPEKGKYNEVEEIHGNWCDVIGYTHISTKDRRFVLYNQYLCE